MIETAPSASSSGPAMSTPSATSSNKRRLSEHFQSSIKKFLDKKQQIDKQSAADTSVQGLLKSFRKEKFQNLTPNPVTNLNSNHRFKSNCSILNETLNEQLQQTTGKLDDSQIEIKLDNTLDTSQLNISTDSFSFELSQLNQSTLLKIENLLNEEKQKQTAEFEYSECGVFCDSAQSFNSLADGRHEIEKEKCNHIEEILSSKSSVNSEEGYYSNHDSSSTVSTLINETMQKSMATKSKPRHNQDSTLIYSEPSITPDISSRRLSIYSQLTDRSMLDCKLNMQFDYSRFSYNCYSASSNNSSSSS